MLYVIKTDNTLNDNQQIFKNNLESENTQDYHLAHSFRYRTILLVKQYFRNDYLAIIVLDKQKMSKFTTNKT